MSLVIFAPGKSGDTGMVKGKSYSRLICRFLRLGKIEMENSMCWGTEGKFFEWRRKPSTIHPKETLGRNDFTTDDLKLLDFSE